MSAPAGPELPPRPLPPVDYDCCGGGCADCELRLYAKRLAEWQRSCEHAQASDDNRQDPTP